jgi:AbrB family looped-hinge helix DNA binding protein
MIKEITIGPKWEITIPPEMLESLNMKEGDEILIIRRDNEIILEKFN